MDIAWKKYKVIFDNFTDDEIDREVLHSQENIKDDLAFLESFSAWVKAGRPRNSFGGMK